MKNKIIIIALFSLLIIFGGPVFASDQVFFSPQVTIPGSDFKTRDLVVSEMEKSGKSSEEIDRYKGIQIKKGTLSIGEYVISVYNYLLAIVGLVAAIVLMLAGVIWLTAGGSPDKVGQAKNLITGSLTGMVLVLVSYIILRTVNPGLVEFRDTTIKQLEPITAVKDICTWYENTCPLTNYEEKNIKECPSIPPTINASTAICCCHQDYSLINEYAYDPRYMAPGKAAADSLNPDRNPNQDCLVAPHEWKDSKNGKTCWGANKAGWCYNEICWEGEGEKGEPCGLEDNARCASFYTQFGRDKCYAIKNKDGSITRWYRNVKSGRQCNEDSLCCYPKE